MSGRTKQSITLRALRGPALYAAVGAGLVCLLIMAAVVRHVGEIYKDMESRSGDTSQSCITRAAQNVDAFLETSRIRVELSSSAMEALGNEGSGAQIAYMNRVSSQNAGLLLIDMKGNVLGGRGVGNLLAEAADPAGALPWSDRFIDMTMVNGRQYVIIGVPVHRNNEAVARFISFEEPAELRAAMLGDFTSGTAAWLTKSGGDVLLDAGETDGLLVSGNVFTDLLKRSVILEKNADLMQRAMQLGDSGQLRVSLRGEERYLYYRPIEETGWYLVTLVPYSDAHEPASGYLYNTVWICLLLTAGLGVFFGVLLYLCRHNSRRLERIAYEDQMTGGCSALLFSLKAAELLSKSRPNQYALVSISLEKFGLFSGAYGRQAGHRTLKYIYDTIHSLLVDGELVARMDAEYFNILMYYEGNQRLMDRCRTFEAIINKQHERSADRYYMVFSAGACVVDDPAMDLITLRERADIARQGASRRSNSGSACAFYDENDRRRMRQEQEIVDRMESALQNREFVVHFQPKVSLEQNGGVAGAEALVRWRDTQGGMIFPGVFIPIFERNHFITKLDLYVFEQVCQMLSRWQREGSVPLIPISVNFSRLHLHSTTFLEHLEELVNRYGVPPHLIEIELTETIAMEDFKLLGEAIQRMHEIGFRCSIDDFGSGYSSLNMLKEIPVDILKLDRGFFDYRNRDKGRSEQVVESVVRLAKKLNMTCVAEGIETVMQVEFLRQLGCDMVQGYVFAKPMPIEEFEEFVRNEYVARTEDGNLEEPCAAGEISRR